MKVNKAIFFAFFLVVMNISAVFAEDNPLPKPEQSQMNTTAGPEFPDMPIDQNIIYLMGAALVLGVVIIYKNKIKRASV